MAFYQKYRSQKFSELIGQDHIAKTLTAAVKSDRLSHAYLLTGPRGTGKTSTARLLAKAVNCLEILEDRKAGKEPTGENCEKCESCLEITEGNSVDVIEIDAASHTGVDDIRDLIEKARFSPVKAAKKVYIIDEVHMLSKSAFNALLKTLEEPPSHVIFILATTEVHKLPATILSRVQRYDFHRVSKEDILTNLKRVAKSEGIKVSDEALEIIAVSAEGGHRDALGLFEQVASFTNDIKKEDVENVLGIASSQEIFGFIEAIFNNSPEEGLKIAHRLYDEGADAANLCREIVECLRKTLLLKVAGDGLFEDTKENVAKMKELAGLVSEERLVSILGIFSGAKSAIPAASYPLLPVEMAVIEATASITSIQHSVVSIQGAPDASIQHSAVSIRERKEAELVEANNASIQHPVVSVQETQVASSQPSVVSVQEAPDASIQHSVVSIQEASDASIQKSQSIQHPVVSVQETQIPVLSSENSQSLPPSSQSSDMVAAPVLEMQIGFWEKVVEGVKKENYMLAAYLRDAKILRKDADNITVGFKFKLHKETISVHKNCLIVEKVLSEIQGKPVTLFCEVVERGKKSTDAAEVKEGKSEDLEQAAEEIFG